MKKISILLAALTFGLSNAQLTETASFSSVATGTDGVTEILWDQPADGSSGIVSDGNDTGVVYSANDFVLDMNAKINKITVPGFCNSGDLGTTLLGVSFYIINDDEWMPAGNNPSVDALHKFELNVGDPGLEVVDNGTTVYQFILDLDAIGADVVLTGGERYWISTVAHINVADITVGTTRWNWYQSLESVDSEAYLLDPSDLFGAGATSWTPFSGLGLTWGDVAFTIEGEAATAGVSDLNEVKFVLYPNPAKDVLNIAMDGADLKNVTVSNLSGQVVATSKTTSVNISSLPAGVYLVKVTDNKGNVKTSKVVKK